MSWKGDKGVATMTSKNFNRAANCAQLKNLSIHKYGFFPPFVVNNSFGKLTESIIEKMRIFRSISAFQILKMDKPEGK